MASWVAVASAKDAPPPCLIFDIYLFALWMNMQSWKDLLVLVYPRYRRPFILLDCGWSGGRSARPMSRHRLATSPNQVSLPTGVQILSGTLKLSLRPLWHHSSKWSLELVQFKYQHLGPKTQTLNEPPNRGGVVMLLNIDLFYLHISLLSLITVPAPTCLFMYACVCVLSVPPLEHPLGL